MKSFPSLTWTWPYINFRVTLWSLVTSSWILFTVSRFQAANCHPLKWLGYNFLSSNPWWSKHDLTEITTSALCTALYPPKSTSPGSSLFDIIHVSTRMERLIAGCSAKSLPSVIWITLHMMIQIQEHNDWCEKANSLRFKFLECYAVYTGKWLWTVLQMKAVQSCKTLITIYHST